MLAEPGRDMEGVFVCVGGGKVGEGEVCFISFTVIAMLADILLWTQCLAVHTDRLCSGCWEKANASLFMVSGRQLNVTLKGCKNRVN